MINKAKSWIVNTVREHWHPIIIVLLGLTPLLWFEPSHFIARSDYFPEWFNAINTLGENSLLWQVRNGGSPSPYPSYLIVESIWYLLEFLHIPATIIQIMFLTFYLVGAGLAMYFLSLTIYRGQKTAAFVASIFYMFNLFVVLNAFSEAVRWVLIFLPLWLGLFIKIVRNLQINRNMFWYTFCFIVISPVLLSYSVENPPVTALSLACILAAFLYFLLFNTGMRLRLLKKSVKIAALLILINIWWFIPAYYYYTQSGGDLMSVGTDGSQFAWLSARASIMNLFRLNGVWSWMPDYVPYTGVYSNAALILLSFVPMVIAFTGLFFKQVHKRLNLCLVIAILALIFFQKGLHPPFENINLFLYQHIPGFTAFREPSQKFGLVLIIFLALLIGSSADSILETIKRSRRKWRNALSGMFTLLVILVFLVSAFPVFTMRNMLTYNGSPSVFPYSAYVKIPDYWQEAGGWINNQEGEFNILLTPVDPFYLMPAAWGFYGLADALPLRLLDNPFLQRDYGYAQNSDYSDLIDRVYDSIANDDTAEFQNLLNLMNVKYILQRNGIQNSIMESGKVISPTVMRTFLGKQSNIHLVKTFGEIDIYEIDAMDSPSQIYVASCIITVSGNVSDMVQTVNAASSTPGKPVFLLSEQVNTTQWQFIGEYADVQIDSGPVICFKEVNTTKYEIRVTNATQPFFLVFSENYHSQWKAYVNSQGDDTNWFEAFFQGAIAGEKHFLVNGYANAWYIDPEELGEGEEFIITLHYQPQSLFYLGCIISGLTFVGCAGYLVWIWRRSRKPNTGD